MKRNKQRAVALLLTACMGVAGILPAVGEKPVRAAEVDLTEGLVGYWDFENGELTNKAEGSSYTMEKVGSGVTLNSDGGVSGGAAYFSKQADSNLKIAQSINTAQQDFTMAAWVKYDTDAFSQYSDNMNLFQQTGSGKTILYLTSGLTYGTYATGSDVLCTKNTELGTWNHVAITSNHSTKQVQFYLNGSLVNAGTMSGSFYDGITDLLIGSHKTPTAASAVKGTVDELRVYHSVASADMIAAMYSEFAQVRGTAELEALEALIADAKALSGSEDEAAAEALAEKIAEAEALVKAATASVDEVIQMQEALQAAMDAYKLTVTIKIEVDTEDVLRPISDAMFGINHRYHNDGYSSWNATLGQVEEQFNEYVKEASFGSIRYPGGAVANLFDWKRAIGPVEQRKKTVHGLPASNAPISPNFGVDEAMTWIYDDLDAEAIWVYGMGQGSAADAADLFEYLNAPADGDATNPNGGTDWAEVRAENGHEEPYGVTRFEIGNELGYYSQTYWMDGRASGRSTTDAYIDGGLMTFGTSTRTVKDEDWRDSASTSTGAANQEQFVKYDPVVLGSASVYVGGTQWQIVDSLEGQGAANVCTFDYETGKITFGDGTNGNIPASGSLITAGYQTEQDGFVEYYKELKAIAAELNMEVEVYSCTFEAEFTTLMKERGYNEYYDGVVIHPYSDNGIDADDPEFYEKVLGRSLEYNMTRVESLVNRMETAAPGMNKVPVLSEFGIYIYNTKFIRSIGHAVYIANEMIDYIGYGTPYINKHCLVDYPYQQDSLGAGSQCVIQAIKNSDGTVSFVSTPSAKMFSIFNNMTGNQQVNQTVTGNETYYTYKETWEVPTIKVLSTTDDEGNTYVTVVNNRKDDISNVEIAVDDRDLTNEEIEVWYLTSENEDDENTIDNPDLVDVVKTTVQSEENNLVYALAPHSVTSFKIPAKKINVTPTVSGEGGKVIGAEGALVGSKVTVTAVPEEGYELEGWYIGDEKVSSDLEYTFVVEEGKELVAKFRKKEAESEQLSTEETEIDQPSTEQPSTEQTEVKAPAAPKKLKAKVVKKGVRLTWKKVKDADGYIIYRSYKKNRGYKKIATVKKGSIKVYLYKKAKKGKTAYYRIKAYRKNGSKKVLSAYSKTVRKKR